MRTELATGVPFCWVRPIELRSMPMLNEERSLSAMPMPKLSPQILPGLIEPMYSRWPSSTRRETSLRPKLWV
ncbi:hypothetical protein D3C71_2210630 [compost metagenome]